MKRFAYELNESWKIAVAQMRSNKTRSTLTALGVIIGIVAVTLKGTAIGGIQVGFDKSMAIFGDNVLYVSQWPWKPVDDWWNYRDRKKIKTEYAEPINRIITATPISRTVQSGFHCRNAAAGISKILQRQKRFRHSGKSEGQNEACRSDRRTDRSHAPGPRIASGEKRRFQHQRTTSPEKHAGSDQELHRHRGTFCYRPFAFRRRNRDHEYHLCERERTHP